MTYEMSSGVNHTIYTFYLSFSLLIILIVILPRIALLNMRIADFPNAWLDYLLSPIFRLCLISFVFHVQVQIQRFFVFVPFPAFGALKLVQLVFTVSLSPL